MSTQTRRLLRRGHSPEAALHAMSLPKTWQDEDFLYYAANTGGCPDFFDAALCKASHEIKRRLSRLVPAEMLMAYIDATYAAMAQGGALQQRHIRTALSAIGYRGHFNGNNNEDKREKLEFSTRALWLALTVCWLGDEVRRGARETNAEYWARKAGR